MPRPGARNLITDVPGLTVGCAQDEAVRSGVTVVLCPEGWSAAVDVRGGGPGVRETETLAPENSFSRAHAICLSGGSVFGLGAADGVASILSSRDIGVHLAPGSLAIPIVPGAVLHDLANGGDKTWGLDPPYRALGMAAVAAAGQSFELGAVGAGRGAKAGLVKGGLGSASIDLGGGLIVGALVAANPIGSVYMPDGETFWAWPFEIDGEYGGRIPTGAVSATEPLPDESKLGAAGRLRTGANTTLAVIAVTADLSTAEAKRVAMMAHDGMGRSVRPAHTAFDGDVVFALASGAMSLGSDPAIRPVEVSRLGSAAADCLARALARAVYEARDFRES
ncbi:P1 family peptidase [Caulobacter sp. ErkDOM-YI]|uniref:P1 family peptidase n=1 Tax=unclassified Caulobacter TaxID=2648921 RepID=UPI003AF4FA67